MLSLPLPVRIFLCTHHVDLRKSFDGLAQLVREFLDVDPMSGHLFVFRNKRADRLKLLYWDRDGYMIVYKRLEKGSFRFPVPSGDDEGVEIRGRPDHDPRRRRSGQRETSVAILPSATAGREQHTCNVIVLAQRQPTVTEREHTSSCSRFLRNFTKLRDRPKRPNGYESGRSQRPAATSRPASGHATNSRTIFHRRLAR